MTDEFASGWPDQETPSTAEEPADPASDPGIDFDAILQRLDGSRSRSEATPGMAISNLIPASPYAGLVAGIASPSGGPSPEPALETPVDRQASGPLESRPTPDQGVIREYAKPEVGGPVRPDLRSSIDFSPPRDEAGSIPGPGPNSDGNAGDGGVGRPGARSAAPAIRPSTGPLRMEPPAVDLVLRSPARPEIQPRVMPTAAPGGSPTGGEEFAYAGSRQGVSSEDLLKTNELLRQLVEETRRLRVASLPAASPSAYPAR